MSKRQPYDIEATWDDPTERPPERRHAKRIPTHVAVKLALVVAEKSQPLVGQGIADNISVSGMYCRSKHSVAAGQPVEVYINLRECPRSMGLPRALMGSGHIIWVKPEGEKVLGTAIRFDEDLSDDINLAIFVDYLGTLVRAQTPPPSHIRTPMPGAEIQSKLPSS